MIKTEEEVKKIVEDLKQRGLADAVYRFLWFEHVFEDTKEYMTGELGYDGPPLSQKDTDTATIVASRYVYEGDYDCNLPYWSNIENLVGEVEEPSKEK